MPPVPHVPSYYLATAIGLIERPALHGAVDCDVAVVGGGYSGLSAALHLAERGYSVVLLEAQRVAWGASGRNGGQLNTGLRKGPSDLVAAYGRDWAKRLFAMAEEAKAMVHERIARHAIACDLKPGVMLAALKERDQGWMREEVEVSRTVFGYDKLTLLDRDRIRARVASPRYCAGMLDAGAAHLHPLNYALGLARAAEAVGARIFEGSPVTALERGKTVSLTTPTGRVTARFAVLAGNAYLGRLEPRIAGAIMPINNYIIATEPLGEARARALIADDVAVHDTKFVVDYYRLSADRRLLFGGGETYSRHGPADIAGFVRPHMLRVFPQLADVRIDHAWGGTLAITLSRLPQIGRLEPNLYFAHGFSGQGVALTGLAGKLIAEAIAGQAERFDVFARLEHRNFPGGTWLRRPAQVLGMLYYSLRDKM
jgi:gamma-glutamylputrescine oxidase